MHCEHAAQTIRFFVNRMEFGMAQWPWQTIGRQDRAYHAVIFDDAAQFGNCGWNVLQWQDGDAFQSWFVAEKFVVQIIVVSPAQIYGELGHADLTDVHEAR